MLCRNFAFLSLQYPRRIAMAIAFPVFNIGGTKVAGVETRYHTPPHEDPDGWGNDGEFEFVGRTSDGRLVHGDNYTGRPLREIDEAEYRRIVAASQEEFPRDFPLPLDPPPAGGFDEDAQVVL
jgi:hypothetical protein